MRKNWQAERPNQKGVEEPNVWTLKNGAFTVKVMHGHIHDRDTWRVLIPSINKIIVTKFNKNDHPLEDVQAFAERRANYFITKLYTDTQQVV